MRCTGETCQHHIAVLDSFSLLYSRPIFPLLVTVWGLGISVPICYIFHIPGRYFLCSRSFSLAQWVTSPINLLNHKPGGLNNILAHSSEGLKSKIKILAGSVHSEGCERESVQCLTHSFWWFAGNLWPSLACRCITPVSAFIFTWHSPCVPVCVQISPFYKDIGLGCTEMTSTWFLSANTMFANKVPFTG